MTRTYTLQEKNKIIEYINNNKLYEKITSQSLWQKMEKDLDINRTWQSMKEHYKKKLINELHTFNLSPHEINCFRKKKNIPIPVEISTQSLEETAGPSFENNVSHERRAKIQEMLCLECMENNLVATDDDTGFCLSCQLKHKITFTENNNIQKIQRLAN